MLVKFCKLFYQLFLKFGALKACRQNHLLIFCLFIIPKIIIIILREQKNLGVYDKLEHCQSRQSS